MKIDIAPEEIIKAVRGMKKAERDAFLEDLLAATSPEYLASIKEARADYKAGRVKSHAEVSPIEKAYIKSLFERV